MRFTRSWLEEFIKIQDSDDKIAQTLDSIGHEVSFVKKYQMPENTVVGKVLECKKDPNLGNFFVCKVDCDKEILQIVSKANNIKENIFVPVALPGAKIKNKTIKPTVIHGIKSEGMICSKSDLGFEEKSLGIMVLDKSFGDLKAGTLLSQIKLLNDTLFEIEPTANRGDVLSVNGIARELSAACGYRKKPFECHIDDDNAKGIGRVLQVDFEI